ncbi:gamma carbonic anhydrase family protein [Sanyastnella coralliicola]|uniref:gamma carbonic anhydrase family protein n=1 Tax=Sanyastnella coralliicola TaxID=3069118 RepID=UPI0027B91DC2|nr:gamma carbonic anhydrase family protein [Longitalea sp. SCSIO 12813]
MIIECQGKTPELGKDCFIAPNATLIGELTAGNQCSFWFNAVVRADVHFIKLGDRVNVQDGAIIHCTYKKAATTIGNDVSIGHNAIVHGCTIDDHVLIGMGSIVMDGCHVSSGSIIAAGAVLKEGTQVGPGEIWAGVPAKKVKEMDAGQSIERLQQLASNYVMYGSWFK